MTFEEILDHALAMLQRRGRLTYSTLKRQFTLDDAALEDVKKALLYEHAQVVDDPGQGLIWRGGATSTAPDAIDAERRQLTVMFCDLVGSTALAARLDPEEWREVVRAYQVTCAVVIQQFEGYMAQYLGDGLLVYFGYPQAHEDDAQRAVRAGLGMLEAMQALNGRLEHEAGIRLAVRIGIHTGPVVIGEMGGGERKEQLALGDTPNIASRIQAWAAPDTVLASETTYHLVEGYFVCQASGTQALRGVSAPINIYQVLRDSGVWSRWEITATRGLTPLVGREQEVGLLWERWAQARDGMGQMVLMSGEGGIGKSRLVQVLQEGMANDNYACMTFRCASYYTHSAFYPLIDYIDRLLRFSRDDSAEEKIDKLERMLGGYHWPLTEVIPLFAALLSLPPPARYPRLQLSPQRQKQRTQAWLLAWLLEDAARQPVLAVWEDLHWADPSTLELLGLLLDQMPSARLLVLLTARPEFRLPWPPRPHLIQLTVTPVSRPHVEAMIARLTGGATLPVEVVEHIVTMSDGVPLYVEEMAKTILDSGVLRQADGHYELVGPLTSSAIPTTLQDLLMARLDRLVTAKGVAQLAATIGRHFLYEWLHAVSFLDEATLQRELGKLMDAELVHQRGVLPRATYTFKHALIQEAAYQSLLKRTRQQYHHRIAQTLEARFPETIERQPELLAHHYTAAGLGSPAVHYWLRAGQRSLQHSAHREAMSHLTKGLEVLPTIPESAERTRQELDVLVALGVALIASKGQASPDVERVYTRARELGRQVETTPHLFPVLFGLWGFYEAQGKCQTARELAEQLLILAQHLQNAALLLEAHHALGATLFWLGEVAPARAHVEQGIALYAPHQHHSLAFLYGEDPGVVCRAYAARTLWFLGYPDHALQRNCEALALAQEVAHPFSLVYALTCAAALHQCRREGHATQAQAEAAISIATEQGLPYWVAWGTVLQGWALAVQGQGTEGLVRLRQGLAAYRETGAELLRPYFLALLAEVYGNVGQTEAGLSVLDEALVLVQKHGVRFYEAALYCLKGELLLQSGAQDLAPEVCTPDSAPQAVEAQAEAYFLQALDVARRQQVKSLELRVAMSLSRLWQGRRNRRKEAYRLLAEVYNWFTEGFDSTDLQEARALLHELSSVYARAP